VTIRVALAEDDVLVRQGMEGVLASADDLTLVASAGDLDAAIQAIESSAPDVVVTDIRMPPTMTDEGIRLAAEIERRHPGTGVVVLSQYDDPDYVLSLLGAGTKGRAYLLKERVSDVEEVCSAIRTVAMGGSVLDPQVVERLVQARTRRSSPLDRLTPRETEVLAAMARGLANGAIADELGVGVRAVEKHINAIFLKLGLSEEPAVHRRVVAVVTFLSEVG
jgi:DNA-binding NarL/FixJ family response regulator